MADRAAAGGDLLAAQIVKTLDRRLLRHQHREPIARLPDRGDRLDRHVGGSREGEWRISDQPGLDRTGAERFQQRRRGRKLLPLDLVGNVLQHAGRFHHGLRIALLVADPQRGLRRSENGGAEQKARRQVRGGSLCGHPVRRLAFGNELSRQRNQLAAIFDGVDQRIEAADQEVADAEIVIVAEYFGDLLWRADQRRGVAVGAGQFGDLGPQPLVDPGALLRQRQQTPRAGGRMTIGRFAIAGLVLKRGGAARISSALAQAFSSVSARIGRTDRLKRGVGRPCRAAAARTRAVTSRTCA